MTVFTKPAAEVFAPTTAGGALRGGNLAEFQTWGVEVETAINAAIASGALVYATKAALDADLAHDANTGAWVVADPTEANNGIYNKSGASGAGSWTRRAGLPAGQDGTDGADGTDGRDGFDMLAQRYRPGDAPILHSEVLTAGDPQDVAHLEPADTTADDDGAVVRLTGPGIVASRSLTALEPARLYQARFVVRRRVNTGDPANDAVRVAIAWYDQNKIRLAGGGAQTVIEDIVDLTVASGRRQVIETFSRSSGVGADNVAPSTARYARAYVETYGSSTAATDVEIIDTIDTTDLTAWSPDVSVFDGRLVVLESLDIADRLTAVEAAVGTPNVLHFTTVTEAEAETVAAYVDYIEVLGDATVSDGKRAVYERSASPPVNGFTTIDGAHWEKVAALGYASTAEAIAGIRDDAVMSPYLSTLSNWHREREPLNAKQRFGVLADDSAIEDAAFADIQTYIEGLSPYHPGLEINGVPSTYALADIPTIQLPAGVMHLTSTAFEPTGGSFRGFMLKGHGPNGSVVQMDADEYFVDFGAASSAARSFIGFRDLKFVGGLGAYINRKTTAVPQIGTYAHNCVFAGFKQCALGSLWGDDPGWWISACRFVGSYTGGQTIGIYLPRIAALVDIRGCGFNGCTYGIKVAGGTGGFQANWNFGPSNTFLALEETDYHQAAVWLTTIPVGSSGVGENVRIFHNRFSNENLDGRPRILIAAENTAIGSNGIEHPHSTSVTTQCFRDAIIEGNVFDGVGTAGIRPDNKSVVYSYTQDLGRLAFKNNCIGAYYPYMVEFASGVDVSGPGQANKMEFFGNRSTGSSSLPLNTNLPGFGAAMRRMDGSMIGAPSAIYM